MPLKERMDCFESEVSVIDVYDIASEIGKEFEKIIECYGSEAVTGLMPKVITALEHLEVLATKNERDDSHVQELETRILQLERDKLEKANDRHRYERDLELIEDHWKKETQDLESVVSTLQEENKKLKNALADKLEMPEHITPEVDIAALQRLRGMVDQLRDKLRKGEQDIQTKNSEIDELSEQVNKLTSTKADMGRRVRFLQTRIREMIDEHAADAIRIQDLQNKISTIQAKYEEAKYEQSVPPLNSHNVSSYKPLPDLAQDDAKKPRFTTDELKEILFERNQLKARISDLEDELASYRPKQEPESPLEEDSTVQGPLPYEPDDAPWKKSDSGIRKFFRKLFTESNVTFLGNSPKRSLSSLSKIALSGGGTFDQNV